MGFRKASLVYLERDAGDYPGLSISADPTGIPLNLEEATLVPFFFAE